MLPTTRAASLNFPTTLLCLVRQSQQLQLQLGMSSPLSLKYFMIYVKSFTIYDINPCFDTPMKLYHLGTLIERLSFYLG